MDRKKMKLNEDLCNAHLMKDKASAKKIVSESPKDYRKFALNASIFWACRYQTKSVVSELMRDGDAVKSWINEEEKTFLHMACWNGDCDIINYLLSEVHIDVDAIDKHRCTPLHIAVSNGKIEAVSLLLDHKADLNKKNKSGRTPLHCAAKFGHAQILDMLISKKGDTSVTDNNGDTLMHLAASSGKKEILMYLIKKGGTIHEKNKKDGQMPIHKAASIHSTPHRTAALEYLIYKEAKLDERDKDGKLPLELAKNEEHCRLLREGMAKKYFIEPHKISWKNYLLLILTAVILLFAAVVIKAEEEDIRKFITECKFNVEDIRNCFLVILFIVVLIFIASKTMYFQYYIKVDATNSLLYSLIVVMVILILLPTFAKYGQCRSHSVFIPQNENLLEHLEGTTQVKMLCVVMHIPSHFCERIVRENPTDITSQKIEVVKLWMQLKKQTWKGFIRIIALLRLCTRAQDLAEEKSVTFDRHYFDDRQVLKLCEDING